MNPRELNILLIDNHSADAAFIRTILSEEKSVITNLSWKRSLREGLGYCSEPMNKVDVALLDLNIDGGNGINVVKDFHKNAPHIPLIVLTRNEVEDTALKALEEGAQDYLLKGQFERTLIVKSILYAIERNKLKMKYHRQKEDLSVIEHRFRTIIQNDSDGILVVDKTGIIQFANPTAEDIFNYTDKNLLGLKFGIPVLGTGPADIDICRADNKNKSVELRFVEIRWEKEDAYLCTLRDMTQRKAAEEAIRENEEKFRAIASSAKDAIIHLDDDLKVAFLNDSAGKIFKISAVDILQKPFADVFAASPTLCEAILRVYDDGVSDDGLKLEMEGARSNGAVFPMAITLSVFKRRGRKQVVCLVRDITERKKAELRLLETRGELQATLQELQENQKKIVEVEKLNSVKELAGALAHEFSQPLQALYNYLHLIQHNPPRDEYFQKAHEMMNRISELTVSLKNITSLKKKNYLESQIIDLFASSNQVILGKNKKILVVEDEREILETMLDIFNDAGYHCAGAPDGLEALKICSEESFDLIISDVMMPRLNGPGLLTRLRKQNINIPFIFLTGYEQTDEMQNILNEARQVINKPVSFNELLACVGTILDEK